MRLRPSLVWFEWPRGDNFAGNFEIQIKKFCLCWVAVNFPATQLQSKLLHLRTLRLLREQIIKSLRKSKELKMFFFRGVLPTLSSLYKQSERYIFVLSQQIDTNTAAPRLHNHAFFSNEMKQQQTGHVLWMSRTTCSNNFLNQQAMFTTMKSCAHFLISN